MYEIKIDKSEVLRYLGHRGQELDEGTLRILEETNAELLRFARPKTVWKLFSVSNKDALALRGTTFRLEGADIRRHLSGCAECVLMAATLGAELERRLAALQVTDMTRAVVLDSCATAAIEDVCDQLQLSIAREMRTAGKYITNRYSPGYGDMPITCQREFVTLLDTQRKIGLAATADCILTPRKSVTAVIGVSDTPPERPAGRGCAACNLREVCQFRKEGGYCGK